MEDRRIKILMISQDVNITRSDSRSFKRHNIYAQYINKLHIIVRTPSRSHLNSFSMNNIYVYPTNSSGKLSFLIDAYKIGSDILKKNEIDLITTQDPFLTGLLGYILKKRFKKRLVLQVHADFFKNKYWLKEKYINRIFHYIGAKLLKKADTIRVGTPYEKEKLINIFSLKRNKIFVAPVLVDIDPFYDDNNLSLNLYKDYKYIVLTVSRLVPQKDIPTLIKAAQLVNRTLDSVLFVVIGQGPLKDRLEDYKRRLGVENLIFTGQLDTKELIAHYRRADILVMPSLYEGTCLVLVEAYLCGLLCISTDTAGAKYIIQDKTCIFKQGDYKALADKIIMFLEDKDKREKIRLANLEFVKEEFSREKFINNILLMWQETLKQ